MVLLRCGLIGLGVLGTHILQFPEMILFFSRMTPEDIILQATARAVPDRPPATVLRGKTISAASLRFDPNMTGVELVPDRGGQRLLDAARSVVWMPLADGHTCFRFYRNDAAITWQQELGTFCGTFSSKESWGNPFVLPRDRLDFLAASALYIRKRIHATALKHAEDTAPSNGNQRHYPLSDPRLNARVDNDINPTWTQTKKTFAAEITAIKERTVRQVWWTSVLLFWSAIACVLVWVYALRRWTKGSFALRTAKALWAFVAGKTTNDLWAAHASRITEGLQQARDAHTEEASAETEERRKRHERLREQAKLYGAERAIQRLLDDGREEEVFPTLMTFGRIRHLRERAKGLGIEMMIEPHLAREDVEAAERDIKREEERRSHQRIIAGLSRRIQELTDESEKTKLLEAIGALGSASEPMNSHEFRKALHPIERDLNAAEAKEHPAKRRRQ